MPTHLHIICGCFLLLWQSSCDQDYSLYIQYLLFAPLWKMVAYPCPKVTPLGSFLYLIDSLLSFTHFRQGTLIYLIGQLVSLYGQDHGPLLGEVKVLKVSQELSKQHSPSLL